MKKTLATTTLLAITTTVAPVVLVAPTPTKAATNAVVACLVVEATTATLVAHAPEVAILLVEVIPVVVAILVETAEVAPDKVAPLLADVANILPSFRCFFSSFLLLSANRPYSFDNSHLGISNGTKVHNKQIP